jgi:hypothetical protein
MALETGSYINDLVVTNPVAADPKSQGDDHIRLIKSALKETLNGFTGAILVTATDTGSASAHVLTPSTALVGYTPMLCLLYNPAVTNTGAVTVNVSGLGVKSIKTPGGADPTAGDLIAGKPVLMVYDGTNFTAVAGQDMATKAYANALSMAAGNMPVGGTAAQYLRKTSATNYDAAWADFPVQIGSGGQTTTGNVTLTSNSAAAITVTPANPGLYVTLPDATTCTKGTASYCVYNAGDYDYGVKDNAGTQLGWVRARTGAMIGLSDSSTAAGVWAYYGLEKTGITGSYVNSTLAKMGSTIRRITLDANRTCFLFGGADCYAIVYDALTQTWGNATLVGGMNTTVAFIGIFSATDQVLVVSNPTNNTTLAAQTLTISGTSVTVNAAVTVTLGGAVSSGMFGQIIAVGSSWVVSYGSQTTTSAIRAITVSGTVPTIGAESVLSGNLATGANLFASGSVVRTVSASSAGSPIYAKPFTVSGSSLTAGTEVSVASTTSSSFRAILNGNGNIVCQYINTTHYATIFKLTGTTEAASSVSLGTAPSNILTVTDYVAVTASKTAFVYSDPTSSNIWYANILTDTAGTASAGTEISRGLLGAVTTVAGLTASGTSARFALATAETSGVYVNLTLNCSGSSPSVSALQQMARYSAASGNGGTSNATPTASDAYGVRQPKQLISGTRVHILGSAATTNDLSLTSNSILLTRSMPIYEQAFNMRGIPGASASESFIANSATNGATGFVIQRIEAAQ